MVKIFLNVQDVNETGTMARVTPKKWDYSGVFHIFKKSVTQQLRGYEWTGTIGDGTVKDSTTSSSLTSPSPSLFFVGYGVIRVVITKDVD